MSKVEAFCFYLFKCMSVIYIVAIAIILVRLSGIQFLIQDLKPYATNNPCLNIESVHSEEEKIIIKFSKDVVSRNPLSLASIFGYFTEAFELPLLMPPGSAYKASINETLLTIEFPLPFITNYSGKLFCVNPEKYETPPFQLPIYSSKASLFESEVNVSIASIREGYSDSQMKCYGSNSEERWCEARHIGITSGKIVIQTSAHFLFPASFLSLGGRASPFDRDDERISNEPIITDKNMEEIASGRSTPNEVAFIVGFGRNIDNLYNCLFDFLIPMYKTIKFLDLKNTKKRVYVREFGNRKYMDIIVAVTGELPVHLPQYDSLTIFEKTVIGLMKSDEIPDPTRSPSTENGHVFNITLNDISGLRETVLNAMHIEEQNHSSKHPIVSIIESDINHLRVFNSEPLREFIAETCSFCKVDVIPAEKTDAFEFMKISSRSSVVITRSNVALGHTIWMQKSKPNNPTFLVEIRPNQMWCDEKMRGIALASGVSYISFMNSGKLYPTLNDRYDELRLKNCYSVDKYCTFEHCYNFLMNQLVEVELDLFNQTWHKIQQQLEYAYNVKS